MTIVRCFPIYLLLVIVPCISVLARPAFAEDPAGRSLDSTKLGYSLGYQMATDFKRQHLEIRGDMMARGIRDALSGAPTVLSPEQMREALAQMQKKATAALEEEKKAASDSNLRAKPSAAETPAP